MDLRPGNWILASLWHWLVRELGQVTSPLWVSVFFSAKPGSWWPLVISNLGWRNWPLKVPILFKESKISHNYFKSIVTSLRLLSLIKTISCTYLSHLWLTTQSRPSLPLTCTTAMAGFFSSLPITYVDARLTFWKCSFHVLPLFSSQLLSEQRQWLLLMLKALVTWSWLIS